MRSILLVFVALASSLPACSPTDPAPATPATVTPEQFKELGWIVGKWRGAEVEGVPFFESYRMPDDSTIIGITWTDSSFSSPADTSIIHLRNSEVTSGTDAVVTQWEASSIHFEPRGTVLNSYTWKKETPDRWTAYLRWTGQAGTPRERTYVLERMAE